MKKFCCQKNIKSIASKGGAGFTIMEIVVATTVFVVVFMAMLALFNYTLKINRKSEALRQASQGMRNMVEFLVKEVRNGQVDYGFIDPGGQATANLPSPCLTVTAGNSTYLSKENRLGIVNIDGTEECIFYGDEAGNPMSVNTFSGGSTLVFKKGTLAQQILNPPNFKVDSLMFLIRPLKDPYTNTPPGTLAKVSPVVSMFIKFTTLLPTGERVSIYYQTSVTTNQYDIPST